MTPTQLQLFMANLFAAMKSIASSETIPRVIVMEQCDNLLTFGNDNVAQLTTLLNATMKKDGK